MAHNTATTPTIEVVAANENGRGNIGGFRVTCPACGFVFTTSLRTIAEADAREHVAYMAGREALVREYDAPTGKGWKTPAGRIR